MELNEEALQIAYRLTGINLVSFKRVRAIVQAYLEALPKPSDNGAMGDEL